jgi:membrane fusion protein (multidrug efflux system)
MDTDGFRQASDTALPSVQFSPSLGGAQAGVASAPLDQKEEIHAELRKLRLELERVRALERTPQSDEREDEQEEERGDDSHPSGRAVGARRRPVRSTFVVALAALLCVGGVAARNYLQTYEDTDDAQVDGYLDPISARISGTVVAVHVDNNQRVKAGQLLVQLDPRDYQVALEQAQAQIAQAKAELNSARQQYVSAVATIHQAEAQNYLAQRNEQRFAELLKLQVVAQSDFDQYYATARADAATVKVDEAAAASAQRTIGSREAQVQQDQAALDQAELNLSYTRITAPASGIIGNRSAQLGQRVQPGQSLMALTQRNSASDLWVTANFKETQLARMRHSQPVTIHVDALRRDFKGHVLSMPGATGALYELLPPENATGNYVKIVQRLPVRITFDTGQDLRLLRPGMSVEPTVWLR